MTTIFKVGDKVRFKGWENTLRMLEAARLSKSGIERRTTLLTPGQLCTVGYIEEAHIWCALSCYPKLPYAMWVDGPLEAYSSLLLHPYDFEYPSPLIQSISLIEQELLNENNRP